VLIDGPTNGVRALDIAPLTGYFASNFSATGTVRTVVAGNNISITETATSLIISRYTGQGGDDFEGYPTGTINSLTLGTGFLGAGIPLLEDPHGSDDFENETAGATVTSTNYGVGWAGPGVTWDANDTRGSDDFEGYPTGAISSLTAGTGWAGAGYTFIP
jgi:hypothetical protein